MKKLFALFFTCGLLQAATAQVKVIPGGNISMLRPLDPSTFVVIGESTSAWPLYGNQKGKLSVRSFWNPTLIIDHKHDGTRVKDKSFAPVVSLAKSNIFNAIHWGVGIMDKINFGVLSQGFLYSHGVWLTSDSALKTNVESIDGALSKLMLMRGVTYKFKPSAFKGDSINSDDSSFAADEPLHYGLISQEVAQVIPQLVHSVYRNPVDSTDSTLTLDYIGLIPLLLEGIKAQQEQINELQAQVSQCCPGAGMQGRNMGKQAPGSNGQGQLGAVQNAGAVAGAKLYQNTPNPFNAQTSIGYEVPEGAGNAQLFIYNYQGEQLKSYKIETRGSGQLQIKGSEFKAGIYLYSLIIDGQEIATRRMILTK